MLSQIIVEFQKTRDHQVGITALLKNTEEIPHLINLAMNENEGKRAEYSAWLANHLAEQHLRYFEGLEPRIIQLLHQTKNESLLRQWLRILKMLKPGPAFDSEILALCEGFISNPEAKVALKAFSIHLLPQIIKRHPELYDEVDALIHLHSEGQSPAYHSAAKNFRKNFS